MTDVSVEAGLTGVPEQAVQWIERAVAAALRLWDAGGTSACCSHRRLRSAA